MTDEKMYCASMEIGSALLNTIFMIDESKLDQGSNWILAKYLHSVDYEDDGSVGFTPIPRTADHNCSRINRNKIVALSEASTNVASAFMEVIAARAKAPDDLQFQEEPEEMN